MVEANVYLCCCKSRRNDHVGTIRETMIDPEEQS